MNIMHYRHFYNGLKYQAREPAESGLYVSFLLPPLASLLLIKPSPPPTATLPRVPHRSAFKEGRGRRGWHIFPLST